MSVLSDLLDQAKGFVSALEAEVAKEVPAAVTDAEKAADAALDQATGESEQAAPATPAEPSATQIPVTDGDAAAETTAEDASAADATETPAEAALATDAPAAPAA